MSSLSALSYWKAFVGLFTTMKDAKRNRKTTREAVEWYLRKHNVISEPLNKEGFRVWRRALGRDKLERIKREYHRAQDPGR